MSVGTIPTPIQYAQTDTVENNNVSSGSNSTIHDEMFSLRAQINDLGQQIANLKALIRRVRRLNNSVNHSVITIRELNSHRNTVSLRLVYSTLLRRFVAFQNVGANLRRANATSSSNENVSSKVGRSRFQKIGSKKTSFHKYMGYYMNVSNATISEKRNKKHPFAIQRRQV